MNIKITLFGPGYQTSVGTIPKNVYKYIKDEFGGDISKYAGELWNGDDCKIPEELRLADCPTSLWELDDIYYSYGADAKEAYFKVENTDTNETLIENDPTKDLLEEDFVCEPKLKHGQHAMFYWNYEKGVWSTWNLEIDGDFSKDKMKFVYDKLVFGGEEVTVVTGLLYDGTCYEVDTDEFCTDGKGLDLRMI